MNPNIRRQIGFTLIELLVVISIILLLATFGLTKIMGARRDAQMTATRDRLGQIYFHLSRYETKKKRLPKETGSAFVLSIWGNRILDETKNNAEIFFCASLPAPQLTEENLGEEIIPERIHFAGRNQDDREFYFGLLSNKGASKTILVCNKPLVDGQVPHQGDALAVLYADGHTEELGREAWGDWDKDEILLIGPESPVEALRGLIGAPGE